VQSASSKITLSAAAEQAVAADRFAREIVAILALSYAARSRQLNGKAFGRPMPCQLVYFLHDIILISTLGEHIAMEYVRSFVYNSAQASHYLR
jgi:hypothetical protein